MEIKQKISKFDKKTKQMMVIFILSVFSTRVPAVNHFVVRLWFVFFNKTSHSIQQYKLYYRIAV